MLRLQCLRNLGATTGNTQEWIEAQEEDEAVKGATVDNGSTASTRQHDTIEPVVP